MDKLTSISLTDWASYATVFCALIVVFDIVKKRTKKITGGSKKKKKSRGFPFVKVFIVIVLVGVAVLLFKDMYVLNRFTELLK